MESQPTTTWKHLAPKPGSKYRQLFVKGRNIAARTLYGCYAREDEPMSPEQIAEDRRLPLEVVLEAIAYCETDPPEIQRDYELETSLMEARGMLSPEYRGQPSPLSPQESRRIYEKFR